MNLNSVPKQLADLQKRLDEVYTLLRQIIDAQTKPEPPKRGPGRPRKTDA